MKKLASLICKLEGKKSQVSVGNVREILKIFSVIRVMAYMRYPPHRKAYNEMLKLLGAQLTKAYAFKNAGMTATQTVDKLLGKKVKRK